jgi:hypothetical protein
LKQGDSIDEMISMYRTLLTKINVLNHSASIFKLPLRGARDVEASPATAANREPLLSSTSEVLKLAYIGGSIPKED